MKKTGLLIALMAGATAGYSQGTINWSDYISQYTDPPGFSIVVFSPGPGGVEQNLGNTSSDIPPGTATGYTGVILANGSGGNTGPEGWNNGANYTIGLYVGTSPSAVQAAVQTGIPVATDTFAANGGGWDYTGSLIATLPTETGFANGDQVYVELAAWYSGSGVGSGAGSYYQAVQNGLANDPAGFSSISSPITLSSDASLAGSGITDFSLATVATPEPSVVALGVMGASAFLIRFRRKR